MSPLLENRKKVQAFVILSAICVLAIGFLGRTVVVDLNTLSAAQHDDISWNMSQYEVELLRFQSELKDIRDGTKKDLTDLRRRFDILYSRIDTIKHSLVRRALSDHELFEAHLQAAETHLAALTRVIDGPDEAIFDQSSDLLAGAEQLRRDLRQLALIGVAHFAMNDAEVRNRIATTLTRLALVTFVLVMTLAVLVILLLLLFQRSARISAEVLIAKSRFEAMVRTSLDAVVVVDGAGIIVEFNGAAEGVFGHTRADVVGRRSFATLLPVQESDVLSALHQTIRGNAQGAASQGTRRRGTARRKSQEIFPIEYSMSRADTGEEQVCVAFLRDITAEVTHERDLETARDQARAGEKAKSDLLTVMSHEIRTPLNGILGSVSLMERHGLAEPQARHLRAIRVSGELLLSHVNNVLSLSSLKEGTTEKEHLTFELHDLATRVCDSLRASAEARGNRLGLRVVDPRETWVTGRKIALQQCLVNLVGNAIKFTRDGDISVEIEKLADPGFYQFTVADTGRGIAPENLDRIFDAFVMVDTRYDRDTAGTGLGLPITRDLVEDMGGTITVQSSLGEGSLFSLKIPLAQGYPDRAPSASKNVALGGIPEQVRALVVDDNEINRMLLSDMLRELGVQCESQIDGYKAIARLEQERFDIVFLDISMPGIDGVATLARIRALEVAWSGLPAIAVTALATQADRDRILGVDFADILLKPFGIAELRQMLGQTLGQTLDGFGSDRPPAEVSAQQDEFVTRFGQDRFAKEARALLRDLQSIVPRLHDTTPPPKAVLEELHRLAGGAGVLGFEELMECLQTLRVLDPPKGGRDLSQLHAQIEALRIRVLDL
ncbi:MAG: ATP-binding protein [Pelagimonas sp.]|jgi:PAS domain S-box-containing protein|nr:ATP-binding protein [Pelagimonas sp.]